MNKRKCPVCDCAIKAKEMKKSFGYAYCPHCGENIGTYKTKTIFKIKGAKNV